jgi:hypothetical protein
MLTKQFHTLPFKIQMQKKISQKLLTEFQGVAIFLHLQSWRRDLNFHFQVLSGNHVEIDKLPVGPKLKGMEC